MDALRDQRGLRWLDVHLLNTLGVQPAQGRFFSEEETDRAGGLAPPLAIL